MKKIMIYNIFIDLIQAKTVRSIKTHLKVLGNSILSILCMLVGIFENLQKVLLHSK